MIDAGFIDAGPDSLDPVNRTWGSDGDLAGPDPERLTVSLEQGNDAGFTDRLDYVFVGNGATATSAEVFGNRWPDADLVWACDDPSQIATTQESSKILADQGLAEADHRTRRVPAHRPRGAAGQGRRLRRPGRGCRAGCSR